MAFINKGKSLINTQKSINNYKNAQEANEISSQKNIKGQSIKQQGASEDQEQENKVKKSKINIKYNQEIYPKLDEYDPDDLEKLKQRYLKSKYIIDPFLNLWGTVINTEEVQNIEDFSQIDNEQMTLIVNYLQILSEIRNQRILFSTIQINKTTAEELDFQLFEQNKKHLVKSYNLEPFKFLISLVQQPNDQWFLLISNLKKKESMLIDFHRNPKNKTLKDSFDTMVDIYNELYDLNIEYFNMTCLVKNMTEISDSQDTRFYYFIYLYKFITQAKHSQLNVSEYEFETGKDRVLLLILKLKLMINEKLKTVPKPITDLQDQADNESEEHLKDRMEQRNLREEEMNQEENKLLPLIEQYDEDEYQFLIQQHKKAKPIDLKQNFSQHFGIQLSYEDVEILEINEAVTQKMMQFLMNYILYQNQKKLMRKLAMAYIKVDDESDEYFSYRLQWPEFLQDQLTPDIDAFQFLFLLVKYSKKWVIFITEPKIGRGCIADFRYNKDIKSKDSYLEDLKDIYIGDFDIDLSDLYTYYKINRDARGDCGIMSFYYMYKFLNARSYEQINFNNEEEKKQMKDRLLWLLLKMQYIKIKPEFEQRQYFKLRTNHVSVKPGDQYEESSEKPYKPKAFHQDLRKQQNNLDVDSNDQPQKDGIQYTIPRSHKLANAPNIGIDGLKFQTQTSFKPSSTNISNKQDDSQIVPPKLKKQLATYDIDHPSVKSDEDDLNNTYSDKDASHDLIYYNQDHKSNGEKYRQLLEKLYDQRDELEEYGVKDQLDYISYQKKQLAQAELEQQIKILDDALKLQKEDKKLLKNAQKGYKNLVNLVENFKNSIQDPNQKVVETFIKDAENRAEQNMIEIQDQQKNEVEANPDIPHLDDQYKQFLQEKYQQYAPKKFKVTVNTQTSINDFKKDQNKQEDDGENINWKEKFKNPPISERRKILQGNDLVQQTLEDIYLKNEKSRQQTTQLDSDQSFQNQQQLDNNNKFRNTHHRVTKNIQNNNEKFQYLKTAEERSQVEENKINNYKNINLTDEPIRKNRTFLQALDIQAKNQSTLNDQAINTKSNNSLINQQQKYNFTDQVSQSSSFYSQNIDPLEKQFIDVLDFIQKNDFQHKVYKKPEIFSLLNQVKYNYSKDLKQKKKQYYKFQHIEENSEDMLKKEQLADSIDKMLQAESILGANKKYEQKYGSQSESNFNVKQPEKHRYEAILKNNQILSNFYLQTRNDISIAPSYINNTPFFQENGKQLRKQENQSDGNILQIGNERIFGKKQIGKGKVLAEVFDMQIFDKDYHDMIMIDEFSDDMINLAMKYLENEGNKQSRCLYFQVQFKQFLYLENSNIEPDILNLKKMIPRFIDNIFDNLDYLGFPFQQTNKMITHFTLVDFRKKSCVTYQLIDNSQKNNYYQSQGKKFGDKVYTFLQQFHRNKLLRELDFRNWSNEQSQLCFQSASERQGSNIMLAMMNLITQKNTNFKVITDSYVVTTKQKISNFISQNKKK